MAAETIRLRGYREFLRATDRAGKETKTAVRATFREVGEVVREPWADELDRFGSKTAHGLRTVVRTRGVNVEQTQRKTTGKHPDFGRKQQLIGEAVLDEKADEVGERMEDAIDEVADHFER